MQLVLVHCWGRFLRLDLRLLLFGSGSQLIHELSTLLRWELDIGSPLIAVLNTAILLTLIDIIFHNLRKNTRDLLLQQ